MAYLHSLPISVRTGVLNNVCLCEVNSLCSQFSHLSNAFEIFSMFLKPFRNGLTYTNLDLQKHSNYQSIHECREMARQQEQLLTQSLIHKLSQSTMVSSCKGYLGELAVEYVLNMLNETLVQKKDIRLPWSSGSVRLDMESVTALYEVKTQSWTTSGSAHEKIPGIPFKYRDIPEIKKKPLYVILVGHNEFVFTHSYNSILNPLSANVKLLEDIDFWKKRNIHYVGFSKLVQNAIDMNLHK